MLDRRYEEKERIERVINILKELEVIVNILKKQLNDVIEKTINENQRITLSTENLLKSIRVILERIFLMYFAVGAPERMPGIVPLLDLRLFAISTGLY